MRDACECFAALARVSEATLMREDRDGLPAVPAANKTHDGSRHGQSVRTLSVAVTDAVTYSTSRATLRIIKRELEAGGFH